MSGLPIIGTRSWFFRAPGVLARDVGDEVALSPPRRDVVLLSGPAARIWTMLDGPKTFVELVENLAGATELPPQHVSIQVDQILKDLIEQALVEAVADGDD